MRLAYLAIPFVAVLLTACGDDQRDTDLPVEPAPGVTNEYNMPDEPATMPSSPAGTTTPPPADDGTGLGTEYGTDSGEVTDPATGTGTGTTQ